MKFQPVEIILKNGKQVTIREAAKSDAKSLLQAVSTYLMQSEHLITTIGEFNLTTIEEARWIKTLAESENSILLVAIYNGKIIGNIDLKGETRKKIRHNALLGIGIVEEWQNIGLGTALLQCAISWAWQNGGLETLWLHVHATNTVAQRLYEKSGFEIIAVQKKYIRNKDGSYTDDIVMRLDIPLQ